MDYLAFRYSKTKYKVPIVYNDKVRRVNSDDIEIKLKSKGDAIFLSGGLDSSLLAAINKPKMAYVAAFPGYEDEWEWAAQVAGHLEIPLSFVDITKELYLTTLEYLIKQKGDGLHPNEPCLYLIAKEAEKDGFDTMISGEGADGLFGGYTKLLTKDWMSDEETFRKRYLQIDTGVEIPFEKWQEWGMYRFLLEIHTPALIDRAYNACHAAGMGVVFPYLEKGIPQMMWEAPMGQKIDKPILKEIANKYLPKEIIYRKKVGFPVPFVDTKEFLLLNNKIGW
jgi:asparagine synthase (glutamine-hydrolysing)